MDEVRRLRAFDPTRLAPQSKKQCQARENENPLQFQPGVLILDNPGWSLPAAASLARPQPFCFRIRPERSGDLRNPGDGRPAGGTTVRSPRRRRQPATSRASHPMEKPGGPDPLRQLRAWRSGLLPLDLPRRSGKPDRMLPTPAGHFHREAHRSIGTERRGSGDGDLPGGSGSRNGQNPSRGRAPGPGSRRDRRAARRDLRPRTLDLLRAGSSTAPRSSNPAARGGST